MGSVVFLYLSALHIISTVDGDSSVKVTQIPDHVAAIRGTNVTFRCIFPFSQDGSEVEVQWNKKGESGYLDTKEDNRKLFGVKTKGSSFFQFLNVISQDSGVYRCVVVRQGSIIGTGSGSRLTVCVPPTPLKIFSRNSPKPQTLVCETALFHPKEITFTWYKDGTEIVPTPEIKLEESGSTEKQNSEDLYKASSSIEVTQSGQNGSVYTCLVSHVSLKTSAIATFAFPKSKVAGDSSLKVTQIPDHVAVIRGTNVTFHCIFRFPQDGSGVKVQWHKEGESGYLDTKEDRRKLFGVKTKGSGFCQFLNEITLTWYKDGTKIVPTPEIKLEESGSTEKQNSEDLWKASSSIEDTQPGQNGSVYTCLVSHVSLKTSAFATFAFPKSKGSKGNLTQLGNPEDQAGEAAAGDNVAYVTLDLRSSNKTPRTKHQEDRTVYAQTKRGAAANKLTYAALDLPRSKNTGKAKHSDKNSEYSEVKTRNYEDGTFMESGTA
ncbi:tyrosine-protein phosphatase non-receptor type substrate 1-like [Callorhinchus milii]|uniref:tyrosine-protein phosphatase non-receptor type substrate 1-like n=1 Tax=Callorhinchus milii TaxID=7868 RepID=UPI001C3F50DA|nr:tyrosine-protein phosphatase non-receptor type substrate 1-like [Callorhinchus milii]